MWPTQGLLHIWGEEVGKQPSNEDGERDREDQLRLHQQQDPHQNKAPLTWADDKIRSIGSIGNIVNNVNLGNIVNIVKS